MFEVTPDAEKMIKDLISTTMDKSLKLTLCSSGAGCGGPSLKVDMRRPMVDDIIETVAGHTFHIRSSIRKYLEGSVIDAVDTFWGRRLHVKTTYSCMG